jgi:histidyl-tRNA synthetase
VVPSKKLQAPRGTFDVLPEEAERRRELVRIAEELLGRAGYGAFDAPIFEDTELSHAASARPRTSCRRRCSRSRTRAVAP